MIQKNRNINLQNIKLLIKVDDDPKLINDSSNIINSITMLF